MLSKKMKTASVAQQTGPRKHKALWRNYIKLILDSSAAQAESRDFAS
jgi:hypothetical protein